MNIRQVELDRVFRAQANRQVSAGAALYVRERDLPKLLRPGCLELSHEEIIAKLENKLRAFKNSARAGHWSSDGNLTMAVRIALHAELGYGRTE